MLRRTIALISLLMVAGGVAPAQKPPANKPGAGNPDTGKHTGGKKAAAGKPGGPKVLASKGGASLDAKLDLNKVVDEVAGTIGANKNREAWVKSLLEQTMSRTGGRYNVMVFNMQQNYDFNPPAGTFQFAPATFKGGLTGDITYGVWVFSSAATFTNKGDGGFINWAFYGAFTRNRGTVRFSAAAAGANKTFSHRAK
jgi:hypothetical protein